MSSQRPTAASQRDVAKITDALLVLSGHLPLFASDSRKVARAERHLKLRDEAFEALDRLAEALETPKPRRTTNAI